MTVNLQNSKIIFYFACCFSEEDYKNLLNDFSVKEKVAINVLDTMLTKTKLQNSFVVTQNEGINLDYYRMGY